MIILQESNLTPFPFPLSFPLSWDELTGAGLPWALVFSSGIALPRDEALAITGRIDKVMVPTTARPDGGPWTRQPASSVGQHRSSIPKETSRVFASLDYHGRGGHCERQVTQQIE